MIEKQRHEDEVADVVISDTVGRVFTVEEIESNLKLPKNRSIM